MKAIYSIRQFEKKNMMEFYNKRLIIIMNYKRKRTEKNKIISHNPHQYSFFYTFRCQWKTRQFPCGFPWCKNENELFINGFYMRIYISHSSRDLYQPQNFFNFKMNRFDFGERERKKECRSVIVDSHTILTDISFPYCYI